MCGSVNDHGRDNFVAIVNTADEGRGLLVFPDVVPCSLLGLIPDGSFKSSAESTAWTPVDNDLIVRCRQNESFPRSVHAYFSMRHIPALADHRHSEVWPKSSAPGEIAAF